MYSLKTGHGLASRRQWAEGTSSWFLSLHWTTRVRCQHMGTRVLCVAARVSRVSGDFPLPGSESGCGLRSLDWNILCLWITVWVLTILPVITRGDINMHCVMKRQGGGALLPILVWECCVSCVFLFVSLFRPFTSHSHQSIFRLSQLRLRPDMYNVSILL